MNELNIGRDFSPDPAGRYYTDGPGSGEEFREDVLKPRLENLNKGEKLVIILDDGVEGYGSSFLVEGFAGLVKYGYMQAEDLLRVLDIRFTNPDFEFYANKIKEYVREARFASQEYSATK